MSDWYQEDLFGDSEGDRRRDEGMDRVWHNNQEWMKVAILCLHKLPVGWRGLPEDWRFAIIKAIGHPSHHNAWGALTREAKERGLIRPTGVRRKMCDPTSKSRQTDEYERV